MRRNTNIDRQTNRDREIPERDVSKTRGEDPGRESKSERGVPKDVPPSKIPKDRTKEQGRSGGGHHDTESDFNSEFGSAEEAEVESTEEVEGGPAEKSGAGHKGSSRRKKPKPTKYAKEGEKTDDELETANSESEDRSEKVESDRRFDSDTLNQPRPKRIKRQQKVRQRRGSKDAEKGRMSGQADQKGRSARTRTGRGAWTRRGAKRNRSRDPDEPQVELEGEC